MTWRLDDDLQQMLRESARGHLRSYAGTSHFRKVRDSRLGFDAAAWAAMAELGWTGMLLSEAVGGSELGLEPALTLAEEIGRSLSPEPFVAAAIVAATILAEAAANNGKHHPVTTELVSGTQAVTLAWQEVRNATSQPERFETVLRGQTLSGRKIFVPAWTGTGTVLIAARNEDALDNPVILALDAQREGLQIETKRMTDGTQCATLEFHNIAIEGDDILLQGESARRSLDLALARGMLALSAQLDGLASAVWALTADYLLQRVQFERPIADFQAVRHAMVDLQVQIELSAASWRRGLMALEGGHLHDPRVHSAKARCADTAMAMARAGIQYHGAFGYTEEADVGLYLNAALRWSSWLGNAPAHRMRAMSLRHEQADR